MKTRLLAALTCAAIPCGLPADQPSAPHQYDICQARDNQITGANTAGQPLPLLKGDPAHPKQACSVPWASLSPDNHPLPVVGCFAGRLLQLPNDAACGRDTGRLWVDRRWVRTSADKLHTAGGPTTCEELDTNTSAATREYRPDCGPQKPIPQPKSGASQPSPAAAAHPSAAPAASTPSTEATQH
jgi:hypothetical protein